MLKRHQAAHLEHLHLISPYSINPLLLCLGLLSATACSSIRAHHLVPVRITFLLAVNQQKTLYQLLDEAGYDWGFYRENLLDASFFSYTRSTAMQLPKIFQL